MPKTYDVYGIGNALVDIQYRVEPKFLEDTGIAKGLMTLIDDNRQELLIGQLKGLEADRSSGGSAANTMICVANCGGRSFYACKVGDDGDGEFYLTDLEAAGVTSNPSNKTPGITGKCLVMITPDADRTMNTFLGITSTFGPEQIDLAGIGESSYLYIEGYLVASDSGFEAAIAAQKSAREQGTKVSLTLSDASIVDAFKDRMESLVAGGVDLLFCNEDEARMFTGAASTEEACEVLSGRVEGFALTCGAEGALIRHEGQTIQSPGFAVDAVDTNGAGDSFAGAYLFGLTNGYGSASAGKLATYVSSRVVSRYGPRFGEKLNSDDIAKILEI